MAEMRKKYNKHKLLDGQRTLTLMGVANPDQVDQLGHLILMEFGLKLNMVQLTLQIY